MRFYVGAYAVVRVPKIAIQQKVMDCPKCGRCRIPDYAEHCHSCGASYKGTSVEVSVAPHLSDLVQDFEEEMLEVINDDRGMVLIGNYGKVGDRVLVDNVCISLNEITVDEVLNMMDKFETKYSECLEDLRNVSGVEVEVKFGAITYYP